MTQYILLPRDDLRDSDRSAAQILSLLPEALSTGPKADGTLDLLGQQFPIKVLDTIAVTGPRLVDMDSNVAAALNTSGSPIRAEVLIEYDAPEPRPLTKPVEGVTTPISASQVTLIIADTKSGAPVVGAIIVAITDSDTRAGDRGYSDSDGRVHLQLEGDKIAELTCIPPSGYWGAYRNDVSLASPLNVWLEPIDLEVDDVVRHYYPISRFDPDTGVKVGIIDTGTGPHPDLNIVGGANTVTGEAISDAEDLAGHGTHVAGLIGANGRPPHGIRGLAPGVPMYRYRVFGNSGKGTNYAILKAMWRASMDGCDIINLSVGSNRFDKIVEEAIQDARNQGMLVVAAAGNDGRKDVRYPARYDGATAVSAMGLEGTYPSGSLSSKDRLTPPFSTVDTAEFIASFSNKGSTISVTAPGVGAVSTLPGGSFGPMSGTSMAAPVVSGAAASLLSQNKSIWAMPRDRNRSNMIERLLLTNCVPRGFGLEYEGYGMPDPEKI